MSYVFEDERRPADEATATRTYWDRISLQAAHYPRPTDDPAPAVQTFYGNVYGAGPMVLYLQLESLLGRQAVLAGIKSFLSTPGARSVDDLRIALEAASAIDLRAYFDAWVFGQGAPAWPTFAVALTQTEDQVTVNVTQQGAKVYGCQVEVEIAGVGQTARAVVDFGPAPSSPTASAQITFPVHADSYTLDPDHRLIGRDASMGASAPREERLPVWIF